MTVIASIDIGSNAMRMALAVVNDVDTCSVFETLREPVRLGQDVFSTGIISAETILRATETFRRFRIALNAHKILKFRAVGTSALREARNQREFVSTIERESGIKIEIITGEEEAGLVAKAVHRHVNLDNKLALLVDIGGGSIEISLLKDGDVVVSDSVKMGTVRLLQVLEEKKRGQKIFNRMVKEYVKGLRRQLKRELKRRRIDILIGTGGNVEALGDLRPLLFQNSDVSQLKARELERIVEEITTISFEERMTKFGMRPDRADVIVPAGIVLEQVVKFTEAKEIFIPRVGLKEGILYDMLPDVAGKTRTLSRKQVIGFAQELGARFNFDEEHSRKVMQIACELFEKTQSLHKMDAEAKILLEVAAILHDVGQFVNLDGHHKHSYYLIRNSPFVGLTARQKQLVACIARYHRKSFPKMEHSEFAALSPADRDLVARLSSMLRIAEVLDRDGSGGLTGLEIEVKKSRIVMKLKGTGDFLLEQWALKSRAHLFESIFGVEFEIVAGGS